MAVANRGGELSFFGEWFPTPGTRERRATS
jgi:hypothetical protein